MTEFTDWPCVESDRKQWQEWAEAGEMGRHWRTIHHCKDGGYTYSYGHGPKSGWRTLLVTVALFWMAVAAGWLLVLG
jgi:hypothetical protein